MAASAPPGPCAERRRPQQLGRVLALQSHVVRGHVGADAFTFALQRLGLDVGCLYTCQFVDLFVHEGRAMEKGELETLLAHLGPEAFTRQPGGGPAAPAEPPFSYLVSGFVGNPELLATLAGWLARLRQALGPQAPLYVCDPVIGDCNRVYVHPNCIGEYRRAVLPLADVITPNHFEVMWLLGCAASAAAAVSATLQPREGPAAAGSSGDHGEAVAELEEEAKQGWRDSASCPAVALESWESVLHAIEKLHDLGPEVVVLTSVELPPEAAKVAKAALTGGDTSSDCAAQVAGCDSEGDASLLFVVASRVAGRSPQRCAPTDPAAEPTDRLCGTWLKKREGYVGGSGDLFAGLFTGFFVREQFHLKNALQKTVAAVQAVLEKTLSQGDRRQTVDVVSAQECLLQPPVHCIYPVVSLKRPLL